MSTADEYRRHAAEQLAASKVHLATIDPEKPSEKTMLGVLGAVKSTIYSSTADIIDTIERVGMSPLDQRASRTHRLRVASIKGDTAAIDRIIKEIEDELQNRIAASTGGDNGGNQGKTDQPD